MIKTTDTELLSNLFGSVRMDVIVPIENTLREVDSCPIILKITNLYEGFKPI